MIHRPLKTILAGSVVVALFLAFGACRPAVTVTGLPESKTHTITIKHDEFTVQSALVAETTAVAFASYPVAAITKAAFDEGRVSAQMQAPPRDQEEPSWEDLPFPASVTLPSGRVVVGTFAVEYFVGRVRVRVQSNLSVEELQASLTFYNDYKIRIRVAGN